MLRIVNAGQPAPPALLHAAAALPAGAPVIVMIHGYRFSPFHPPSCPHDHILSLDPRPAPRAFSWPRALGFGSGAGGLGIAFGWEARGSLGGAYRRAAQAGADLAALIEPLAQAARRPVALIGHSLGARVALCALPRVSPGTAGRVLLVTGAEFRDRAAAAVSSPGGAAAEIINITSRENDAFDFGFELALGGGLRASLARGLGGERANRLDLQVDCERTLAALARHGFAVRGQAARLCHWSPYLREGLFDLYRALLRRPESLPLATLRAALPPDQTPRWSRLLRAPRPRAGGLTPLRA